jgi:hypothetical protein
LALRSKAAKQQTKFDPTVEVGFGDLIALFNCSSRGLQLIIDGGYIERNRSNLFDLHRAVQGYAKYKSDHGVKKTGKTKEATQSRVQIARAKQIEQQTALQAKDLISRNEHVDIIDFLIGGISVELDGLSAQLTRDRSLRTEYEKKIMEMKKRLQDRWQRAQQDASALDEEVEEPAVDQPEDEDDE